MISSKHFNIDTLQHDIRFSDLKLVQTPNGLFLVASSRELGVVITYAYDPVTGTLSHVDEAYF